MLLHKPSQTSDINLEISIPLKYQEHVYSQIPTTVTPLLPLFRKYQIKKSMTNQYPEIIQVRSYLNEKNVTALPSTLHYPISEMIRNREVLTPLLAAGTSQKMVLGSNKIFYSPLGFVTFNDLTHTHTHLFAYEQHKPSTKYDIICSANHRGLDAFNTFRFMPCNDRKLSYLTAEELELLYIWMWQMLCARHGDTKQKADSDSVIYSGQHGYPV